MRWVYLIIVIVFVAAIVLFAIQNVQLTTMSFLGFSIRAPLSVMAAVVYVLGAFTGGSLFALIGATIRATKAHWPAADRR
jgi:lipopolysaccharide assembly protein A